MKSLYLWLRQRHFCDRWLPSHREAWRRSIVCHI